MMETINLPEGNAFGVDDVESGTPTVDYAEHQAKTLFFVWVTLTEQKWVIFGERRGFIERNTRVAVNFIEINVARCARL